MKKKILCFLGIAVVLLSSGCVDMEQEVHINHDASGKIIERVAVTARGLRLLEGMRKRAGKGGPTSLTMMNKAFQERKKALGAVELVSKTENTLPDGRKQIEAVYSFKHINDVTLSIAPTFSYMSKIKDENGQTRSFDGALRFEYIDEYVNWGRLFKETVRVNSLDSRNMRLSKLSTPADRQKFKRIMPIYIDMLKDFHLSIKVIAPIEEFEDPRFMLWGVSADGNRVNIYNIDGEDLAAASDLILQLAMNEVDGGLIAATQAAIPSLFTSIPDNYRRYGMRFMKPLAAPTESEE